MVQFKLSDFDIGRIGTKKEFNLLIEKNKDSTYKLFTPIESSLFLGASIKAYKDLCAYFALDDKNDFQAVADSLSRLFQILDLKAKIEHKILLEQIIESSDFPDESKKSMLVSLASGFNEEDGYYCIRFENCIKHHDFIFEDRKEKNYVEVKLAKDGSDFAISDTIREKVEKSPEKASNPNLAFYLEQAMLMGFDDEENGTDDEGWDDDTSSDSSSETVETSSNRDAGYGTMQSKTLHIEIPKSPPVVRAQEEPGDEVLLGSSPTGYSGIFYMPELSPKASTNTREGHHNAVLGASSDTENEGLFTMDI